MEKKRFIGFSGNAMRNSLSAKRCFALCSPLLALCFIVALSSLLSAAHAADKLTVKNAGGTSDVFKVSDNGNVNVAGTDSYNAFQLKLMGHGGGVSHVQLVTDQSNSRMTFMAGQATDYAPRFQAVGAQNDDANTRGWALFDYGSALYNLPNAEFKIRYIASPLTIYEMVRVVGRNKVIFPTGNVGIGTDPNPNAKLDVQRTNLPEGHIDPR